MEKSGPVSARAFSAALGKIRRFNAGVDHAVVTRLAETHGPYGVLVSTIISLRTRDEVTDLVTPRLLAVAPDIVSLSRTPAKRIARLIYPAGFYNTKAKALRKMARVILDDHDGKIPDRMDALLELDGVGRKTANLVLTLGFGKPGICVDIHVHRISNRVGFVRTETPDETEHVLRKRLPRRWWIPINDLLVVFGQRHCMPISPKCSTCPIARTCRRVGVTTSR